LCFAQRIFTLVEASDLVIKGITGLLPVNIILVLAFAIGAVCSDLGTGKYVAQIFSAALPAWLLPVVIFGVSCLISFSTGSSWGTFAIMIPVAVPAATALQVPLPLAVGAVLSGGVFGDHASILSDTTIVSAMASAADLVDHFTTQLPYALLAAGLSAVLYLVAGFIRG
jgi:Na+/H+ antiporter NhaC